MTSITLSTPTHFVFNRNTHNKELICCGIALSALTLLMISVTIAINMNAQSAIGSITTKGVGNLACLCLVLPLIMPALIAFALASVKDSVAKKKVIEPLSTISVKADNLERDTVEITMGMPAIPIPLRTLSIQAEFPGVLHITKSFQEGDKISKGEPMCMIESMKMHLVIGAPHDGIFHQFLVRNGQSLKMGDVIFEMKNTVS